MIILAYSWLIQAYPEPPPQTPPSTPWNEFGMDRWPAVPARRHNPCLACCCREHRGSVGAVLLPVGSLFRFWLFKFWPPCWILASAIRAGTAGCGLEALCLLAAAACKCFCWSTAAFRKNVVSQCLFRVGPHMRLTPPPNGMGLQVAPPLPFYLQAIGSISEVQPRIC